MVLASFFVLNLFYAKTVEEKKRFHVIDEVRPSLFAVRTKRAEPPEFLKRFISEERLEDYKERSSPYEKAGNGFCIDGPRGYILTAAHIVTPEGEKEIVGMDGAIHPVTPIWVNEGADVAMIVHPDGRCIPLKWTSSRSRMGVNAHFFGTIDMMGETYQSFTLAGETETGKKFDHFGENVKLILTDRGFAIGSAGAPLVGDDSQVMGMIVAIYSPYSSSTTNGLGLSVSAETLKEVIRQNQVN